MLTALQEYTAPVHRSHNISAIHHANLTTALSQTNHMSRGLVCHVEPFFRPHGGRLQGPGHRERRHMSQVLAYLPGMSCGDLIFGAPPNISFECQGTSSVPVPVPSPRRFKDVACKIHVNGSVFRRQLDVLRNSCLSTGTEVCEYWSVPLCCHHESFITPTDALPLGSNPGTETLQLQFVYHVDCELRMVASDPFGRFRWLAIPVPGMCRGLRSQILS